MNPFTGFVSIGSKLAKYFPSFVKSGFVGLGSDTGTALQNQTGGTTSANANNGFSLIPQGWTWNLGVASGAIGAILLIMLATKIVRR